MRYLCIINNYYTMIFVAESLDMARDYMKYSARAAGVKILTYKICEVYEVEEG